MKANAHRPTLVAIEEYWKAHGYAPSVRELKGALSLSSTSVVAHYLRRAWVSGHLTRDFGRARTLRLTEAGRRFLEEGED